MPQDDISDEQRAVIWSGTLSFGLVNVPVRVQKAVVSRDVRFREVHATDGGRIRHKRVCELEDREVPYEEVAKLHEDDGEPVVLTREELQQVAAEQASTIDVLDFVRLDEVDPIWFERTYYLLPGKGGEKGYRLLVRALRETGQAAIGRVVLRAPRERLVSVKPLGDALTMTILRHADEVRMPEDVADIPEAGDLSDREVVLAGRLVEELVADFEPRRYEDQYRGRLLDLIDAKRRGAILAPPDAQPPEPTSDLEAALEESLRRLRASREESRRDAEA